jgi:beta-lactamase class A
MKEFQWLNNKNIVAYLFIISLVLNITLVFFYIKNTQELKPSQNVKLLQEMYPLLSKRIHFDSPQDLIINFLDLRVLLRSEVMKYGDSFGFFFEYLPTGTSIGINEKVDFHAASLFKVPVVMAYFHMKERTRLNDDPVIILTQDMMDTDFGELYKRGVGYPLNASEAVRLALVDSDNTAVKALTTLIEKEDFEAVYQGLDIDLHINDEGALLSAKSYSSILKALYFSAVLSKDSSHKILEHLTKTKFPDKLEAGVPRHIPVAHKIGDFLSNDGVTGFRDCGIVYAPRRPYILCMFSVSDEETARVRMQSISKIIYEYVSSL